MRILPNIDQMRYELALRKDNQIESLLNVIQSKDEHIAELQNAIIKIDDDSWEPFMSGVEPTCYFCGANHEEGHTPDCVLGKALVFLGPIR